MLITTAFPSLLALISSITAIAFESTSPAQSIIEIQKVDRPPKLEDFLEMKPGSGAPKMTKVENFIQRDPKDGAPAQEKTEVYIGYDAQRFYAVFVCFDKEPGKIRAHMTRREDIGPEHDEVQLYLDTFNDKRRSYGFMINPRGVQLDYIWTDTQGYDLSWDTVWDSGGKVTPQGYVAFMSIPFKSLRFPATHEQTWGILFQRVVPHDNDNSFYPHVSSSLQGRLNQEAQLRGLRGISPGRNIQLTPYAVADGFRVLDQRDPNHPFFTGKRLGGRIGLDGKLVIKDGLVLDVTANPDFRQLESDQPQNTVNQRFEVFFPEKRPFFQEGANFFDTPINLYFTRRISDPQFGLRLTGKLGPYGIGILAVDDKSPGQIVPDNDPLRHKRAYFTVGRLTRELWKQSHVGLFYGDRELDARNKSLCSTDASSLTEQIGCTTNSNRVGGVDFRFQFGDHWGLDGQAVTSTTDQVDGTHLAGPSYELHSNYNSRHWIIENRYQDTSPGFVTLTGFFRRPDLRTERNFLGYTLHPEGRILTFWRPQLFHLAEWDHRGVRLDYTYEPGLQLAFKQSMQIIIWKGYSHEQLRPADFSILSRNTDFRKDYWGMFFTNSYFKRITFNGNFQFGIATNFSPPDGKAPFSADESSANLSVTLHPLNAVSVDNSYVLERLRSRHASTGIFTAHIIRSKLNYQYNKELSFRAIFQYNGLVGNPAFTSIIPQKNFNADFLVSYLVHPGTALYFGYNSNLENLSRNGITSHTGLFRTRRSFLNDERGFFVKASYLWRF